MSEQTHSETGTRTDWMEWLRLFANRDEVATAYADLMGIYPVTWDGWRDLNLSIIDRWSSGALIYIKQKAWKRVSR